MMKARTKVQTRTHEAIASAFVRAALAYFVVVGGLGTWLRARFIGLMPSSLNPSHVIHAHSHVAYFGWASLALFAGIYYVLPKLTGRPLAGVPFIRWQLRLTHVATVGALVTFSTGGYTPASIVFSTLNVLIWYGFVAVYRRNVAGLARPLPVPLRYLHVAVVLLVVSSIGTWLISAVTAAGVQHPLWQAAGLYVFLNNFTDGWLLIGLLGLVTFVLSPARAGEWAARPLVWMTALTPLAFLADLVPSGLSAAPAGVGIAARSALVVPYGVYLFRAVRQYGRSGSTEGRRQAATHDSPGQLGRAAEAFLLVAALFFFGKIVSHAGSALATVVTSRQLFVGYLHLDLLGFFSCGLIGVMYGLAGRSPVAPETSFGAVAANVLAVGVAGMVSTLLGVAVVSSPLLPHVQAAVVEQLLEAAFVFAVVSLVGMLIAAIGLARRWRAETDVVVKEAAADHSNDQTRPRR